MATFADVAAAALADAGIEYIFGVPGSLGSVELIEAASKRGIRYILCSNESSAAVMAGTYGVMRNRPGVVSTGVGPGAVECDERGRRVQRRVSERCARNLAALSA